MLQSGWPEAENGGADLSYGDFLCIGALVGSGFSVQLLLVCVMAGTFLNETHMQSMLLRAMSSPREERRVAIQPHGSLTLATLVCKHTTAPGYA